MSEVDASELVLREPTPDDGAGLWELVRELGKLDLNSPYAYLLVGRHLASTSVVADLGGEIVGFVSGYRPPIHDDVIFVWQVGVHPKMRGHGLAKRMLMEILGRDTCKGVRWVESTVTPNNLPSQRLFRSLARQLDTEITVTPYFPRDLFPVSGVQSEELYRIGPIDRWNERDEARGVDSQSFKRFESVVRTYCRAFPTVFDRGDGHVMIDERGVEYLDFFAGAGALAYGHNEPRLRQALIDYIERGGITQSLDFYTTAKRRFLERFQKVILEPRGMDYRVMFPGPTGTNATEAAIKLARKVTRRSNVIAFTNGYHGVTLGSLALTADRAKRRVAGTTLGDAQRMPYDGYHGSEIDTAEMLERYLKDESSGVDLPAAIVVETVQAEGGVNVARDAWLRRLDALCKEHDIFLVVDELQIGCGRTGTFFSFEKAGIEPDVIVLSRALSGYGLPLSVVLIEPERDLWAPGEHGGNFRGNDPAMVTATAAIDYFWETDELAQAVVRKGERVEKRLRKIIGGHPELNAKVRGRGLIWGLDLGRGALADAVAQGCFERNLIVETCGPRGSVLKLLPPLTIPDDALDRGLDVIAEAVEAGVASAGSC